MTMRGLLRLILILTLAVLPAAMVAQTEPVLTNYFRVPSFSTRQLRATPTSSVCGPDRACSGSASTVRRATSS